MTPSTNPTPYIIAAFAIGGVLIFGYAFLMLRSRKNLEAYLEAKNNEGHNND